MTRQDSWYGAVHQPICPPVDTSMYSQFLNLYLSDYHFEFSVFTVLPPHLYLQT